MGDAVLNKNISFACKALKLLEPGFQKLTSSGLCWRNCSYHSLSVTPTYIFMVITAFHSKLPRHVFFIQLGMFLAAVLALFACHYKLSFVPFKHLFVRGAESDCVRSSKVTQANAACSFRSSLHLLNTIGSHFVYDLFHKLHYLPQQFLYFNPLPQGQGSFRPIRGFI